MDAKSRAWERLQAELRGAQQKPETPKAPPDPRKETLLQRFQRMANQQLTKQVPEPEAA